MRIAIAWSPVNVSFGLAVPDDAYYYFTIARNIAAGYGATADRLELTNGFHPLWMLFLVPLWSASPWDKSEIPVHLALSLGAIFDLATICGLWWLSVRLTHSRTIGMLVALAYALNPYALAASVNGLETSLSTALLVWSLALYWSIRTQPTNLNLKKVATLLLLWSLMGLARTDYLLLILPCALELAWRQRHYLVKYLPAAAAASLLWLPWLMWNYFTFGTIVQVSALTYPYYRHVAWDAQSHTIAEWFVHQIELGYHTVGLIALVSGFGRIGLIPFAAALAAILGAQYLALRKNPHAPTGPESATLPGLILPTVGFLGLLFIHSLVRWQYALWYFAPAPIFLLLWFAILLERIGRNHRAWMIIVWSTFVAFQIWQGANLWTQGGIWPAQREFAEKEMPKVRQLCEQFQTIGISDSGYIGYYLRCRVINLDGVVNNEAFKSIQQGNFRVYLDAVGIQYVSINQIVRDAIAVKEGPIPTLPPYAPGQHNESN